MSIAEDMVVAYWLRNRAVQRNRILADMLSHGKVHAVNIPSVQTVILQTAREIEQMERLMEDMAAQWKEQCG